MNLTWNGISGKPFSSVGSGLTVYDGALKNDGITGVRLTNVFSSGVYQQKLQFAEGSSWRTATDVVYGSEYLTNNSKSTSGSIDTFTFTNAIISTSAAIDVYCNKWGVVPTDVIVSTGSCIVNFNSSDSVTECRIYIKHE